MSNIDAIVSSAGIWACVAARWQVGLGQGAGEAGWRRRECAIRD